MSVKRPLEDEKPVNGGAQPKTKKQFTEHDRELANIYDQLADEKYETRIEAAKDMVAQFTTEKNPEYDGFDIALRRLIKGLCSPRKAARAGFFVALTELLRDSRGSEKAAAKFGSRRELLLQIDRLTKTDTDAASLSKQANRNSVIGRTTAYKAVLQSSLLTDSALADFEDWEFFVDQLCIQAQEVSWLREECGSMICEYITASSKVEPSQEKHVKKIVKKFAAAYLMKTPEGVAIWLTARKAYPELHFPKDIWHKRDPLHGKERSALAQVLCESKENRSSVEAKALAKESKGKSNIKGSNWKPQPNFAWQIVFQEAFQIYDTLSKFQQFWIEVVDNSLFADKASSERKSWGFSLTAWAMTAAPQSLLPALFTPNFMRCLVNQRFDAKRELFKAANQPLDTIIIRGEKDADSSAVLVEALLSSPSSVDFDRATKSKTLERLASLATNKQKMLIITLISGLIRKTPSTDLKEASKSRAALSGLLVSMCIQRGKQQKESTTVNQPWAKAIVDELAGLAYLVDDTVLPLIEEDTRSMFHEKLIQCVNHLFAGLANPGQWLSAIVSGIDTKVAAGGGAQLVLQADDDILKTIKKSQSVLHKLQKRLSAAKKTDGAESEDQTRMIQVLQLLFSLILLEVYSADTEAVEMLTELLAHYTSMDLEKTEAKDFDQLIELLLSFLSRSSSFYRQMSERIFPVLATGMSEDGLDSLLDILSKKETLAGQEELFESANGVGESDADDSEDGSMDSDVEMMSGSEDEADEVNGVSSGDSDDDNGAEESDDEELKSFNKSLAQALQTSVPNPVTGIIDDDASASGSDMDDDQMMALDPHITKIFQERRKLAGLGDGGVKKKKVQAKLQMTLFKSRVLDLLQIYSKKQHADVMTLKIIVPLLELMRTTTSAEIETKARRVLLSWWDICDRNKVLPPSTDDVMLWTLLREVHDEVQKHGSKIHDITCSRASLFITKILMAADATNITKLIQEYATTQTQWMENAANVQLTFFTEWCGWCAEWKKHKGGKAESKAVVNGVTKIDEKVDAEGEGKEIAVNGKKSKKNKKAKKVAKE